MVSLQYEKRAAFILSITLSASKFNKYRRKRMHQLVSSLLEECKGQNPKISFQIIKFLFCLKRCWSFQRVFIKWFEFYTSNNNLKILFVWKRDKIFLFTGYLRRYDLINCWHHIKTILFHIPPIYKAIVNHSVHYSKANLVIYFFPAISLILIWVTCNSQATVLLCANSCAK